MKKTVFPAPLKFKHLGAPISMALEEIEKLFLEILREHALKLRNFNQMLSFEDLCDPSNLNRMELEKLRISLEMYRPIEMKMMDSSTKSVFYEAIGTFWVYEKTFHVYNDCFRLGFKRLLDRAEEYRQQEISGKDSAKRLLRMEKFKEILSIAEKNVDEYPKLLQLKEVVSDYHYGFINKVIFASNATAPYIKDVLNKWGLKAEVVKNGKGIKNLEKLKSGDLNCLVYPSVPKIKLEIDRLMIIHYLLPKNREDMNQKNECNGSIAPELVYYIYLKHFLDVRFKKITENWPKSPRRKKGQGILDFTYD